MFNDHEINVQHPNIHFRALTVFKLASLSAFVFFYGDHTVISMLIDLNLKDIEVLRQCLVTAGRGSGKKNYKLLDLQR